MRRLFLLILERLLKVPPPPWDLHHPRHPLNLYLVQSAQVVAVVAVAVAVGSDLLILHINLHRHRQSEELLLLHPQYRPAQRVARHRGKLARAHRLYLRSREAQARSLVNRRQPIQQHLLVEAL